MKRPILLVPAVFILVMGLVAFEWPVDPSSLRFNFGFSGGSFKRGSELGVPDAVISASADGDLVFACDAPRLPGGYPLPDGSLAAISHDSGMMSIYTGIQPGSLSSYMGAVRTGDPIGVAPQAVSGRFVSFYVYDSREKRFVNPFILLPKMGDDKPPVIRSIAFRSGKDEIQLDRGVSIRQGAWLLVIDASDMSPMGLPSAPFELRVVIDGSERFHTVYDAAWASSGESHLFSAQAVPEKDFFLADGRAGFGPVSLTRGTMMLTVIVTDFSGNKREVTYSIQVQ